MLRARTLIAVVLLFTMTPASGEILENAVHLILAGHTAHALADETHQPDEPEHGCSGPFHVCPCHSPTPLTAPGVTSALGSPAPRESRAAGWAEAGPFDGYLDGVFRPPIG
jgi:hypothetical protein